MLSNLKEWFRMNRAGGAIIAFAVCLVIGAALVSGCQVSDFISVDVPREVQGATGAPPRVTLTEAPIVMEDYIRYGERFGDAIDAGNERLAWLVSVTDIGLRIGASQLPAGGLGVAVLMGLGGLFLKGPGTFKEKTASYAKGKRDSEAVLLPLLKAAGIEVPE